MNKTKFALLAAIAVVVAAFFALGLDQHLTLDTFKHQQAQLQTYHSAHPGLTALIYFGLYIVITSLSVPGALLLTLAGGAIFGVIWGSILVSFASSIGATVAFLLSRFVLGNVIQTRYRHRLEAINDGIARDGAFYLFAIRLVPLFPYFVVNLVMGLTSIKTRVYYLTSQLGMLPATIIYVNAGTQLAKLESTGDIVAPGVLGSLVLLGIFPLLAKKLLNTLRARRVLKPYAKPRYFDRNVIVIGAGSAGLVAAYIAAAVKAKVTLIEKHKMGGDCLNTGCVPSKALLRSAKFLAQCRRASELGIRSATAEFDFAQVMERVQSVIREIEPHDSVERYSALGVDCVQGEARITSPYRVEVDGRTLTTRSIIIAAGARPFVPPIAGIENIRYWTSDTIWNLRERPQRLVVLGGGPIGCELSQAFARLGCTVTQVEMAERLLIREDPEIAAMLHAQFEREGIDVRVDHRATAVEYADDHKVLVCAHGDGAPPSEVRIEFDELLVAVGRVANTEGYGLETLGIPLSKQNTIETDAYLQTLYPNIYACGDVAGPYQFTHVAAHQAWYASVNSLFGSLWRFKADYSVIPWATFTEPEVARVGLNEQDAQARGIPYEVTSYDIGDLDRAIADGNAYGLVKVLTVPGKDRILGATLVGEHAGDLISEFVSAMRHGIGLNKILGTIHIYPTMAEANKYVAGVWKRTHAPDGLLAWLARYHRWRLGGSGGSAEAPAPADGPEV